MTPFLGFDWQSALTEANFIPCKKIISSGLQPAALGVKRHSMHGFKAFEAAHPSWCGGEVDALFRLTRLGRATMLHDVVMENTGLIRLCSLRLNALARENHTIAALNARVSSAPDQLVEKLMV